MEFLVEFDVHVPEGTLEAEVQQIVSAEARQSRHRFTRVDEAPQSSSRDFPLVPGLA